jgi:hypothetical protein
VIKKNLLPDETELCFVERVLSGEAVIPIDKDISNKKYTINLNL